jgi:DeoD family purine-nucleoside phosphorylase
VVLHLRPSAEIAPDALLPGDPGRALALAQELLEAPKMSNHHRGLWGYWGQTAEGQALTIQSTGMGGPSAAIVLSELAELGVRRAVRVGTCGTLDPNLKLGDPVLVARAIAADGASRALGAGEVTEADPALTRALARAGEAAGGEALVASSDLFYEVDPEHARRWAERGAVAVEMEAAALFTVGRRLGVAVGCLLVVSDTPFGSTGRERISDEQLLASSLRMGRVAAGALSGAARAA